MDRLSKKYNHPHPRKSAQQYQNPRLSSKKDLKLSTILQKTRKTTQVKRNVMNFSTPSNNKPKTYVPPRKV